MRKRLAAVLVIAVVAIMAYGAVGSAAWFTDSDSVTVTATSGQIDMSVLSGDITVSNLMPGVWTDANPLQFKIYNHGDSTVPVKYRVTDEFVDQSVSGLYGHIMVEVDSRNCDGSVLTGNPVYQGPISGMQFTNFDSPTLFAAGLPINYVACYNLQFGLDSTAGNAFQNQTAHFKLDVVATQLENPGWAE